MNHIELYPMIQKYKENSNVFLIVGFVNDAFTEKSKHFLEKHGFTVLCLIYDSNTPNLNVIKSYLSQCSRANNSSYQDQWPFIFRNGSYYGNYNTLIDETDYINTITKAVCGKEYKDKFIAFGRPGCGYSENAQKLAKNNKNRVIYKQFEFTPNSKVKVELMKYTNGKHSTWPFVFYNGSLVGGYTDLARQING